MVGGIQHPYETVRISGQDISARAGVVFTFDGALLRPRI